MSLRSLLGCSGGAAVAVTLATCLSAGGAAHAAWGLPGGVAAAEGAGAPSAAVAAPQAAATVVAEVSPAEAGPTTDGGQSSPAASIAAPAVIDQPLAEPAEPPRVADLPPRRVRPRFLVAVSMGASIDASWSASTKTFASPTFSATVGFGEGPLGFGIRLLSSQASGRPGRFNLPDRLALDVMVAVRPWGSRRTAEGLSWGARALRSVTLDVGLAAERITAGPMSAVRGGPVFGGHVDLPLTAPARDGELRLRVAARRMMAGTRSLGDAQIGDSAEVLGGLAVAF